jgi:hypothetical protein
MMNWKGLVGSGHGLIFKALSRNSPGGIEERHEKSQSGYPFAGAEILTREFLIRSRSVNHSTMTFGVPARRAYVKLNLY